MPMFFGLGEEGGDVKLGLRSKEKKRKDRILY